MKNTPVNNRAFHTLTSAQAIDALNSSNAGLSFAEATNRRTKYGFNEISATKKRSALSLLVSQFLNFVMYLLFAAAVIAFLLNDYVDGVFILFAIMVNSIMGFVQEYRAEKALDALKSMITPKARVMRDGKEEIIESKYLVPGDVILIEEGNKIPADCRVIESHSLECSEASLTGESLPVAKYAEVSLDANTPLAERENMLYSGTIAARGRCRAIVTSTGMQTEFGKVASLVQSVEKRTTPLQEKLDSTGKKIALSAIAACAFILLIGIAYGRPAGVMFLTAVSLAVAAIPEGLPAVVTVALALGVQKMAARNAIVRKLPSVETLGSTTVICSDKTGTLTKNEMTVRKIALDGEDATVSGEGYSFEGKIIPSSHRLNVATDDRFNRLVEIALLCNNSTITNHTTPKPVVAGDPTEAALVVLGRKFNGLTKQDLEMKYSFVQELGFDSIRKMMSVVYQEGGKKSKVFSLVKGAPENILEKSSFYLSATGDILPLTSEKREEFAKKNEELAHKAMRLLGFAYRELPALSNAPANEEYSIEQTESDLTFVGVVGIIDPPRAEAKDAVVACKQAGIKVAMITGDNPITAKAIATELGILVAPFQLITGKELDKLSDEQLQNIVEVTRVFARVSPEHKLRIVQAFQKNGEIVAMTGDGVNDAPSLKQADIGVAMEITGTEVAKEASEMVLLDDNFATIVAAVEEGRNLFNNMSKSIKYIFSTNIGALGAIFVAMVLPLNLPILLTPIQILWMNLVTDSLPAIALGIDKGDGTSMQRPPRNTKEPLISIHSLKSISAIAILMIIATLGSYFYSLKYGHAVASAISFTTFVFFRLFMSLSFKSIEKPLWTIDLFSNKLLWATIVAVIVLQVALVYIQPLQMIFGTTPFTPVQWLIALAFSSIGLVALEVKKLIFKK